MKTDNIFTINVRRMRSAHSLSPSSIFQHGISYILNSRQKAKVYPSVSELFISDAIIDDIF